MGEFNVKNALRKKCLVDASSVLNSWQDDKPLDCGKSPTRAFENQFTSSRIGMNHLPPAFWSISGREMLLQLQATAQGLTTDEARARLTRYGANLLKPKKKSDSLSLLISQFKSPLILILLFATGLSFFLHDPVNALIILTIVLVSGLLGFWQEHSATNAVEKLLAIVQIKAAVLRDGSPTEIPVEEIVPGDIVILNAGDIVPGDCLVQESKDLFVDEATLTGETYPVEKSVGVLCGRDTAGPADKCAMDGDPCGERQRQGAGHKHRQANRVRQGVRAAKTQTAGNGI